MKKKKKGSSLVLVLIVFAILSILATSTIAMTSSDYYRRITETKRLQNLYGAESGLDITYNILAKTVESSVKYANKSVEELTTKREGKPSIIDIELEKVEKGENVLYPVDGDNKKSRLINTDGTVNRNGLKDIQQEEFRINFNKFIDKLAGEAIEESKLVIIKESFGENGIIKKLDDFTGLVGDNSISNGTDGFAILESVDRGSAEITTNITKDHEDIKDVTKFVFEVESKFKSKNEDINGNNQDRIITAKYIVEPQEYGQDIEYSTVEMEIHPLMNKVISIEGDMNVTSNTNIKGDIFVNGNSSDINEETLVYDKYKGGIKIDYDNENANSQGIFTTTFNVTGDIVTPKTLLIQSKSKAELRGNVYAGNIHIGKLSAGDSLTSDSYLKSEINNNDTDGIYLSNDLSIYGNNIDAEIENFYGINDITSSTNVGELNSNDSKAVNSSSIIINSNNFGKLDINKRAYIWGTAYINTESKYQTGESVAVKGNYMAYSDSLGKDVEFIYDNPLQLISKINGQDANVFNKADHIKEYYDKNPDNLDVVGITLPPKGNKNSILNSYPEGTFTAGAYITNSKIENTSKNDIAEIQKNQINSMQKKFVNNVFYMGMKSSAQNDLLKDFPLPNKDSKVVTVNSDINFSVLKNKNEITSNNDKVIFNNDSNKTIVIVGANQETKKSEYDDKNKYIKVLASESLNERGKTIYKLSGLIITSGSVIIDGNIEFKGSIISGKDLTLQNSSEILIKEDIDLVRNLIAKYYNNDLADVIKKYNINGVKILPTETIDTIVSENNSPETNILVSNYIKMGSWTIENTAK